MYLYLTIQQNNIKQDVNNKIEKGIQPNELVQLTFPRQLINEVLRWEHEKEFEYKGQMYDVVEVTEMGDSLTYLCWWDKAETISKKNRDKLLQAGINKSNSENQLPTALSDFYKSIYLVLYPFKRLENPMNDGDNPNTNKMLKGLLSLPPLSPPPRRRY
jgi:hypothetical protein